MIFKICCFNKEETSVLLVLFILPPVGCSLGNGPFGTVAVSAINPPKRCGKHQEQNQRRIGNQSLVRVSRTHQSRVLSHEIG